MGYDVRVWARFGIVYGVSSGIILGAIVGVLWIAMQSVAKAINTGGNGFVNSLLIGRANMTAYLSTGSQLGMAIIAPYMIFVLVMVLTGVITLVVYTAILHYAGLHLSGYDSIAFLSVFIPIFGVTIHGLLSIFFPDTSWFTGLYDLLITVVVGIVLTWVSLSLAYVIWIEVLKQPESDLAY